jgi:translocation and assembly module TamA
MILRFIYLIFITISLHASSVKELHVKGDIDLIAGDFSKDSLLKACNIAYPPFYKIWQKDPAFTKEQLHQCTQTLTQYAHSFGFYKAQITLEFQDDKATLHVKKNEPIRIFYLEADDSVRPLIPFSEGDAFSPKEFTQTKRTIQSHFWNLGYPKAELDSKAYVNLEAYEVEIVFTLNLRGIHTFGPVKITNNANVDEKILRTLIPFKEGDRYSANVLEKTHEELYNLGLYRFIGINQDLDKADGTVPVEITLQEGDYKELGYGFGYDTDNGGKVFGDYKNSNFRGNLKQFSTGATVDNRGVSSYMSLFLPRLYWNDALLQGVSLQNDATFEDKDYESYKQRKIDGKIGFSKKIWGLEHTVGALSDFSRIRSKLDGYESGDFWINALFYQTILDRRDDSNNPKNGYYFSFLIEHGTKLLASDETYIKTLSEARFLKSFDPLKVSFKTTLGTLDNDLPIHKRFFAGGDYSNRGYAYQKVGILDSQGNPYGGLSLIETSLEFEYPIFKDTAIALFWDATMLEQSANTFTNDFVNSVGFGVRYYTPIGPLRMDLGVPLDDDGVMFHLGIGQVF